MRHLRPRLEVRAVLDRDTQPPGDELDRMQGDGIVERLVVVAREALDRVRERVHPRRGRDGPGQPEHQLGVDQRHVRADQRRAADVELELGARGP